MKKEYVKPTLHGETFITNEYVSACWWVNCNIKTGNVYLESNGKEGLQKPSLSEWNGDKLIGMTVSGCGTKHTGVTEEPVSNSYWVSSYDGSVRECFSWQDSKGWHSTYIGDEEWDTNPNAS